MELQNLARLAIWNLRRWLLVAWQREPRVSRRSHHGFEDIHIVANLRRRQRGNMMNELFHGKVGDVGQIPLTEEGIHPLV